MREKAGRNPKAEGGRRKTKTESRKLILRNFQSPGDIVMLTAAVRDLHRCYPGRYWWICSASVSEHRAGRFVVFRKQRNAVNAIMAQAKQFRPLFENPPADMPPEEELRLKKQIMDDLSDLLLDLPEPLRSELLQKLTPMREKMAEELAKIGP